MALAAAGAEAMLACEVIISEHTVGCPLCRPELGITGLPRARKAALPSFQHGRVGWVQSAVLAHGVVARDQNRVRD